MGADRQANMSVVLAQLGGENLRQGQRKGQVGPTPGLAAPCILAHGGGAPRIPGIGSTIGDHVAGMFAGLCERAGGGVQSGNGCGRHGPIPFRVGRVTYPIRSSLVNPGLIRANNLSGCLSESQVE